jgi:hypothetical protein
MAYGTVKVDTIIFDQGGTDQNVTASGIYRAITSGVTVTGTISGAVLIGTTTVSGATVTGTAVQGTTVQGVSGTFTSLTGTTTTGTTANFVSGVFTTRISGTTVTGDTGQFTSGTFVSLTGTTITGTTINAVTVSSTTGTFGSITGTTITGTTINGATVNSTTGNFTSLTGVTVTGTTAQFASGVFITQVSGLTVTGTQSSFTSGNFVTLSGATATFTSGIIASGTAAAPSLAILGDPNTGIYSPGADQVAVATNGTGRLFVASDGKVFHNHNGAVATNPFSSAHVPRLVTTSTEIANFQGLASVAYNGSSPGLWLGRSAGTTVNTFNALTSGNAIGGISFAGADGTSFINAARIQAIVDGAVSTSNVPGALLFLISASGPAPTERLRITSAGLVGIGTSAPTAPLTVIGANNATQAIFGGALGTTDRGLRIATGVLSGNNDIAILDAQSTGGGLLATLVFQTASTERMRITSTGNVGIGTTTPTEKLTVSGNVSVSGNVQAASINNGPLAGMRNAIINGNFDIWQRGTSFSNPASSTYTADRWQVVWNGSGATRTVSQQAFTLGQTDVAGEPTYFIKYNQSVAGSGGTLNYLRQPIESVRTFAGQQVTVSFYAKAASVTTMPVVSLAQFFGSGGSPSGSVFTDAASSVSITTSWQRFTYSVTLPSITGKTLGSDGNDWMGLIFELPLNAAFNIDIAQVQVEPGPVATPFERRPIGTELALCQRYYFTCSGDMGGGYAYKYSAVATVAFFNNGFVYPVQMRDLPTFIWDSPILENCALGIHAVYEDGVTLRVIPSGTGSYRARGGVLSFNAEL